MSPQYADQRPVCGGRFHFGSDKDGGQYIPAYRIVVCMRCYKGNRDGWAPYHEDSVTRRLKELGLPMPPRNAKGLLPRDG